MRTGTAERRVVLSTTLLSQIRWGLIKDREWKFTRIARPFGLVLITPSARMLFDNRRELTFKEVFGAGKGDDQ